MSLDNSICSICFDPLFAAKNEFQMAHHPVALRCGHVFHADCCKTYHHRQTTQHGDLTHPCPICSHMHGDDPVIRLFLSLTEDAAPPPADLPATPDAVAKYAMAKALFDKDEEVRAVARRMEGMLEQGDVVGLLSGREGLVGGLKRVLEGMVGGWREADSEEVFTGRLNELIATIKDFDTTSGLLLFIQEQREDLLSLADRLNAGRFDADRATHAEAQLHTTHRKHSEAMQAMKDKHAGVIKAAKEKSDREIRRALNASSGGMLDRLERSEWKVQERGERIGRLESTLKNVRGRYEQFRKSRKTIMIKANNAALLSMKKELTKTRQQIRKVRGQNRYLKYPGQPVTPWKNKSQVAKSKSTTPESDAVEMVEVEVDHSELLKEMGW